MSSLPRPSFPSRYLRFGPFELDSRQELFRANGTRLNLQGKPFEALLALLQKPGEVVTREELRHRLWNGAKTVDYESNVNTIVNKLRQTLGDSSQNPSYIATKPRRGYVFVAQIEYSEVPLPPVPRLGVSASAESPRPIPGPLAFEVSTSRRAICVIGLLLAGMLIGAGLASIWFGVLSWTPPWP